MSLTMDQSDTTPLGRNDLPYRLWRLWSRGQVGSEDLRMLLSEAWQMAEWPTAALGARTWLAMFKSAGFVSDCGSQRPQGPVVAYRGALQTAMRGFSWTTDPELADWFANRIDLVMPGEGRVFKATVAPTAVLGHFTERGEDEVVLNPFCLRGRCTPTRLR